MAEITEQILRALAAKQAEGFNSSGFSGFVNDAGAEAGGKLSASAQSIAQALMAPGNAVRGEYDQLAISPDGSVSQFDPRMMDDAATLAGSMQLGAMPMPRPRGSLGMGGRIVSDAVPENFPIKAGEPFPFMHNTEGAFNYVPSGSAATALDPKGRFIVHDQGGMGRVPDQRWVKGETQFNKPLIIQEAGWKEKVSQAYGGLTGKKLTDALKRDGYDGIVTFDKYGTSEIVDLK